MYDILIVGGGVAGCGAGITLGSSEGTKTGELKTLIIDSGKSHLKSAELHNVPFVKKGTSGEDALAQLKADAVEFKSVEFVEGEVLSIDGKAGDFTVKTNGAEYKAKFIILAVGANQPSLKINGKEVQTVEHGLLPKPGTIKAVTKGRQEIEEGIYAAGLFSGVTTMYATALGSGVEAACAILSKLNGQVTIIHDSKGSRK